MEQRVRNLEDLCELITKQVVEQNKNMIEINKNLINEIKCLREAYVKQDVSITTYIHFLFYSIFKLYFIKGRL
jgi:t-SNARE complex subunit (syntaxin)